MTQLACAEFEILAAFGEDLGGLTEPEWQRLGNASCLLVTHQVMHNQLYNLLPIF
jgi:hypothetical protein